MADVRASVLLALLGACSSVPPVPSRRDTAAGEPRPSITVLHPGELPRADGFYLVPASARSHPLRRQDLAWEPDASTRATLYRQLQSLASGGCLEGRAELPPGLPGRLVRLERLEGRPVVYDACDGHQPRLSFVDGLVESFPGMDEPALMAVQRVAQSPEGGVALTLTNPFSSSPAQCSEGSATLQLTPLSTAGWYRVQWGDAAGGAAEVWSTPGAAADLDVLVHVCTEGKAREYPFSRDR
jgi:hypothetical protein